MDLDRMKAALPIMREQAELDRRRLAAELSLYERNGKRTGREVPGGHVDRGARYLDYIKVRLAEIENTLEGRTDRELD